MKTSILLCFITIAFFGASFSSNAQCTTSPKTLYVDNFPSLLGSVYENELDNYIINHNITHVILYGVDEIFASNRHCQLANFIRRYKTGSSTSNDSTLLSNGKKITAVYSGNWYSNFLDVVNYNNSHYFPLNPPFCSYPFPEDSIPFQNTLHEIDAYQFENEFWNDGNNTSGYLNMFSSLTSMKNYLIANNTTLEFEIYLARFNNAISGSISIATQAQQIADSFDLILVTTYGNDTDAVLSSTQSVISNLLSNTNKTNLPISILYSNLCNSAGPWLRSNNWEFDLYHNQYYLNELTNQGANYFGLSQNKLQLINPTWFSYSFPAYYPYCDATHPENSTSNAARVFESVNLTLNLSTCPNTNSFQTPPNNIIEGPFLNGQFISVADQTSQSTNNKIYQLTNPTNSYTFETWVKISSLINFETPPWNTNLTHYKTLFSNYSYNHFFTPANYFDINLQQWVPISSFAPYLSFPFDPNSLNGFSIIVTNERKLAVISPNYKDLNGNAYNWSLNYNNDSTEANYSLDKGEVMVKDENSLPANSCVKITITVTYLSNPDRHEIIFFINGVPSSPKTVALRIPNNIGPDHSSRIGKYPPQVYYMIGFPTMSDYNNEMGNLTQFSGMIDDVRLWNTALPENRVTAYQPTYNDLKDFHIYNNTTNLVANWRMDERFMNQVVKDNSANHYDAYLGSSMLPDESDPQSDVSCVSYETQVATLFDGNKKFLQVPSNSNLNIGTGEFFFEAWLDAENINREQVIMSNRDATGSNGFIWGIDAAGSQYFQFGSSNRIYTDPLSTSHRYYAFNLDTTILDYDQNLFYLFNNPIADVRSGFCRHVGIERVIDNSVPGQITVYMRFYLDNMRTEIYDLSQFNFIYGDITQNASNFWVGYDAASFSSGTHLLSFEGRMDDIRAFNISDYTRWVNSGSNSGLVENEGYFLSRSKRIMDHYSAGSNLFDLNFEDFKKDFWPNFNGTKGNQDMENRSFKSNNALPQFAFLGNSNIFENFYDPYFISSCSDVSSTVPEMKKPNVEKKRKEYFRSKTNALITVYPNPFTDVVKIKCPYTVSKVTVTDVMSRTVQTEQNKNEINTSKLTPGIYFLTIETINGQKNTVRIIKL